MKISFRLNKEYDADIINELENLKKENLSKKIRQILRDYFMQTTSDQMTNKVADKMTDTNKTIIKWNFSKEKES